MPCAKVARSQDKADVILPMNDPYMDQIITGQKNHEFRKYRLQPSVKGIWFYRTAAHSSITHVCETMPARTQNPSDAALEEERLGNAEFNRHDRDWEGCDFTYKIISVYELLRPISLREMKDTYGFKSAPRGLVSLPPSIGVCVDWRRQKCIVRYFST